MNSKTKKPLPTWLPLLVGGLLVAQFAGLGAWQISRGLEKRATQAAYQDESGFTQWQNGDSVRSFQRLKVGGRYEAGRQIILDNIIINSRYGHYVLTPLETAANEPLLLVNRGWIERSPAGISADTLSLPNDALIVHGRCGLPAEGGLQDGRRF